MVHFNGLCLGNEENLEMNFQVFHPQVCYVNFHVFVFSYLSCISMFDVVYNLLQFVVTISILCNLLSSFSFGMKTCITSIFLSMLVKI